MAKTEQQTPPLAKQPKSRIPHFKTIEDEAAYWESHSPLDYPEEFQEVAVKVERSLGHILGVRLEAKTIDQLAAIGRKKGIGPSTLARIWIMERLSDLEQAETDYCIRPG